MFEITQTFIRTLSEMADTAFAGGNRMGSGISAANFYKENEFGIALIKELVSISYTTVCRLRF